MSPIELVRWLGSRTWRLVITAYQPEPTASGFLARAETLADDRAIVRVAVPSAAESRRFFGVGLAHRGIQPVFIRVENHTTVPLRLRMVAVDPHYFTPLEAAAVSHFSIVRRLSGFGLLGWLFFPCLALVPLKLITAGLANRRMDRFFSDHGFRLAPVPPGGTAAGFVFATLDLGTKVVRVRLDPLPDLAASDGPFMAPGGGPSAGSDFTFTVTVPGIAADHRDGGSAGAPTGPVTACDAAGLATRIEALPGTTTDATGRGTGDPVNLVVVGDFETLLGAFAARWDESETISLRTCWKTVRAFLLGTDYRYSPVSPLHLFDRTQDFALQRTRRSINERLHLRLWRAPLTLDGAAVWVGQVSRDIGVRFTTRAWNLTTHRIDPDVDESRDYVLEDLAQAGRVAAAGYVGGVGACTRAVPGRNLTGDPYFTDGRRVVIVIAPARVV